VDTLLTTIQEPDVALAEVELSELAGYPPERTIRSEGSFSFSRW